MAYHTPRSHLSPAARLSRRGLRLQPPPRDLTAACPSPTKVVARSVGQVVTRPHAKGHRCRGEGHRGAKCGEDTTPSLATNFTVMPLPPAPRVKSSLHIPPLSLFCPGDQHSIPMETKEQDVETGLRSPHQPCCASRGTVGPEPEGKFQVRGQPRG